jgi:hypothetical protein
MNEAKRLVELYILKADINLDEFPAGWRQSFEKFMCYQTMYIIAGSTLAFWEDYSRWFYQNRIAIYRESKIDQIV